MFLYRSLTVGLLGACLALIIKQGSASHPVAVAEVAATGPTIVDVAPGVRAADVDQLVRLSPGEKVVAFEDRRDPDAGGFLDLDVAAIDGSHRRVLVLLH